MCVSQKHCTEEGGFYYTIRITERWGVWWYNNIDTFQYNFAEIEAPFLSGTPQSRVLLDCTVSWSNCLNKVNFITPFESEADAEFDYKSFTTFNSSNLFF